MRLGLEYVNTMSNVAGGGSREGLTCQVAKACGIALRVVPCPALPIDFPSPNSDFRLLERVKEGIDPTIESKDSLQTQRVKEGIDPTIESKDSFTHIFDSYE